MIIIITFQFQFIWQIHHLRLLNLRLRYNSL